MNTFIQHFFYTNKQNVCQVLGLQQKTSSENAEIVQSKKSSTAAEDDASDEKSTNGDTTSPSTSVGVEKDKTAQVSV